MGTLRRDVGADSAGAADLHLPKPGAILAERFQIERLAGRGGMGAVFCARDLVEQTPVAIKVIGPLRGDGDERFAREARVLAELSHPAIVRYVAHGLTEQGVPFLAMEWLDGEDLAQLLTRELLSPAESFALIRRVAEGVSAAHERGVVHRDLKPSNLFLVSGEVSRAKVLDFGVARFQGGEGQTLTRAGTVLGTVGYMAPEQAMGLADIDARADVFSLGCVLFECLTGRAAFQGSHDVAVLAKVLRDEPPLVSELRPELGSALDGLLACMMAKDRTFRPRNGAELLRALERVAEPLSELGSPRIPVPRHLTASERKIASVILARTSESAQTLASSDADHQAAQLEELAKRFDAEPLPLRGGGLVLSISGRGAASDQACRAAACALALRKLRPELHVAVATGSVENESSLPIGEAIDRAALLLEVARPQLSVAIDELTHGLLGGRFDVRHGAGGLLLFGELGDVEAPRLWMGQATPCVGREKELALFDATLDECRNDAVARLLLVTAAPGIGKSRLGRAFLERVRGRESARVIVARADQMASGSALALAERLLRNAVGLGNADAEEAQRARLRDYLDELMVADARATTLDFLAELIGLSSSAVPSPLLRAARSDPEVMREQTRRAFEAWLAAEAERAPLLVLIEDLHWGDAASVSYLEHALKHLAARPILLLAFGRPELRELYPSLLGVEGAQEVRLAGLTRRAAERLVRMIMQRSDATIERIVERADGNAFYLEELARCVVEGSGELPATVLAMVQSRLERLELAARRVLRAASVFGGTCYRGGVALLLGSELDASEWLEALAGREILVRRRDPRFADEQEYEFRHALLRDAAYAMLTDDDRILAHRAAGRWLEQVGERDARVLADHFERGGVAERAVHWLVAAAIAAMEAGDFEGAVALAGRGLALGASGEQRGKLCLVEGYGATFRGQPETKSLAEALALLPQATPYWWLALSALMFGAMSLGRRDEAFRYLQLATATPPGAELVGPYGAALQAIAAGMVIAGRTDWAWSVLDKFAHVTLDDGCDPLFLAWLDLARCQLATASPVRGAWQLERALSWGRSAAQGMRTIGSTHGRATACFYLGYTSRVLGLYGEAEEALSESLEHAERSGSKLIDSYSTLILTLVRLHRGAYEDAQALLDGLRSSADPSVLHGVRAVSAEAQYQRGELEVAREAARSALEGPSAPYRRVAFCTLARAELALGDHAGVLTTVARALADEGAATPEYEADLLASEVEARLALGEAAAARSVLDKARGLVDGVAAGIEAQALRQEFLRKIDANARVMALCERLADKPEASELSPASFADGKGAPSSETD